MQITFGTNDAVYEVAEVGYNQLRQVQADELGPGEVGYVVANVRSVRETRAGDTVFDAKHKAPEPLPGYQEVRSFVFAGIYPTDTTQYELLRDALEKLQLNDASLQYEPRRRRRSASASAAGSSGCCTWRSCRSGWSASTTSTSSPRCRAWSTRSTRPTARWT
jgi:GTP-binding protein LepA